MSSGLALKMQLKLSHLAKRHRIMPPAPFELPLSPPIDGPVEISGIAGGIGVDRARTKFRPYALGFLEWQPPLLKYRHQEVAGAITRIWHDATGQLRIEARVDHPQAARCQGLSVCATIKDFEIVNADDPRNFHALVTRAWVDEVSLTSSPCNTDCLVSSRFRKHAIPAFFDDARRGVEKARDIVALLREQLKQTPEPPPKPKDLPRRVNLYHPPRPRLPTQFQQLVRQLEARA